MSVMYIRDGSGRLIPVKTIRGAPGKDGKSAYEYAVAGGYTGTEEEFAEKLAAESPAKLSDLENDLYYEGRRDALITLSKDDFSYVEEMSAWVYFGPRVGIADVQELGYSLSMTADDTTVAYSEAELPIVYSEEEGLYVVCDTIAFAELGPEEGAALGYPDGCFVGIFVSDYSVIDTLTLTLYSIRREKKIPQELVDINLPTLTITRNGILQGTYNGTEAKTVKINVPTKTSQLTNDSGFLPVAAPGQYGAKGDGATDDTEAFRTALAENRVVHVPGGTYVLSGELTIGDNCVLELSQDTVLWFKQSTGNCISLKMLSSLRGNHATVKVDYGFSGNVISADSAITELADIYKVTPFTAWDPQWKYGRYVTDLNITKADSRGYHYSVDGDTCGTAVYIHAEKDDTGVPRYMWGIDFSGLRIAGAFRYGIHGVCANDSWVHEMRLAAFIDACETGVCLEGCNNAYVSAIIQPRRAYSADEVYSPYAKYGIKLVDSKNVDLSGSRVWDWNETNTLWTAGSEYQHIALYGQCRGLILNDFFYYEMPNYDIRDLIYTDTESNLEQLTILQEPFTRWFKPVAGVPYFNNGETERRVILEEDMGEYFSTARVANYTDALAIATDGDGNIYNGVGYKKGAYFNASGTEYDSGYPYYISTGFIPAAMGDVIYTKNISFDFALKAASGQPDGSMKIAYYDANKAILGIQTCSNVMNGSGYYQSGERTEDGLKITLNSGLVEFGTVAFVRFVFHIYDFGDNPAVSVNEEIKFNQEGFLAEGIRVNGNNVLLSSPGGKTFRLLVDENGGLSTEIYE